MKVEFHYIERARQDAGFFVDETIRELGIGRATWYRWKRQGKAPIWALKLLELMAGRLDHLGWKHWYIKGNVLYRQDLSPKYYKWDQRELIKQVFRGCESRAIKEGAEVVQLEDYPRWDGRQSDRQNIRL